MGLPDYIKIKKSDFFEEDNNVIDQKIKTIVNYLTNEKQEYKISKNVNNIFTAYFQEMDRYCYRGDYRKFNYEAFDIIYARTYQYLQQGLLLAIENDIKDRIEEYTKDKKTTNGEKDIASERIYTEAIEYLDHYLEIIDKK